MKKTVLGGIVGGIILFLWGFLAWTVLPLHEPTLNKITDEDAAISTIQPMLDKHAVYVFPKEPAMNADQATRDTWTAKLQRGPSAMIFYKPTGSDPAMTSQMIFGLILAILSAWVVCWFLARSIALNAPYVSRVAYCGMFGLFVSVFNYLMQWNWMEYPVDYTSAMIIDAMLGWILAGLGIAAVVKAPKLTTT